MAGSSGRTVPAQGARGPGRPRTTSKGTAPCAHAARRAGPLPGKSQTKFAPPM